MIRKYRARDLPAVLDWVTRCTSMHPQEATDVLADSIVYLYEQRGVLQGVAAVNAVERSSLGKTVELYLLTDPAARNRGIGGALWERAWPAVLAADPDTLTVQYRLEEEEGGARDFFAKRGFERWLGLHLMQYTGEKFPEPDLPVREYEDRDFDRYVQSLSDAFYELRRENDCRPYALTESVTKQSRDLLLQHREFIYVCAEEEARTKMIGSFAVKGPTEIDDLFIAPEFQGQGYGRRLAQFAVNRMLERGANPVTLSVVTTNTTAYELYNSLGFQRVQTSEISRMTLKTP
ncbi:GNAT family N-acetyltransferase [Tumebacillus flagellatus]|uniref:N-acetyltransferase domain-containing protein n=1 Tax=Tumebacillus flagellatus TaxID=1157490 RepID=A0A074LQ07_9BACL|nr:GNAT family N-acetyltransferase [Tumebacillus flagellatus]KEO84216.1 hypothetical protein EL26_05470 [Tumebacillus flagellatus]